MWSVIILKSKLFITSMSTIIGLYGVFILFLLAIFTFMGISLSYLLLGSIIFLAIQFLIAPYITDWIMRVLYKANFNMSMPDYLVAFINDVCRQHNMKYPKIGYIDDGAPNAFTYGRTKNDARIILTRGIFELLTPEEVKTVVAHEMGHAVHYDMFFMTVAQMIPLVLRWIYEVTIRSANNNNKNGGYVAIIGIVAFILHVICQYVILWFSRTREYFADEFAVEKTYNPNAMASALVKIGYGLVTANNKNQEQPIEDKNTEQLITEILTLSKEQGKELKEEKLRKQSLQQLQMTLKGLQARNRVDISSVSALGIFDSKSSSSLVISSYNNGNMDLENIKKAARWELWNPWAGWFELHSTHPRISKRLKSIFKMAPYYSQQPFVTFDEQKPESYVDDFLWELLIQFLPLIITVITGGLVAYFIYTDQYYATLTIGIGLMLLAGASLIKLRRAYKHNYVSTNIANLLGEVKVSHITSVPCELKGTFIGRGTPGFIFSEDFVLRDETGIVFIDYKQPLSIMNFFFGLFKAKQYINKEVVIHGWYKRAPVPYVELYHMTVDGVTKKCYTYGFKKAMIGILFSIGIIVAIAGMAI